jgi:uncharacterized protein
MLDNWQPIQNLPAAGRDFSFTDQEFWFQSFKRYALELRLDGPIMAKYHVMPSGKGFLIRGGIQGGLFIPCDRCLEETKVEIDDQFEIYEEPAPESQDEPHDRPLIRQVGGRIELDEGAMLWEQLILALPVKPLCGPDCKGLCPVCGQNLNAAKCDCHRESGDPRLAVFRNMKLS